MTDPNKASDGADGNNASSNDEAMRKLLKPAPKPDQVIGVLKKSFILLDNYASIRINKELDSYDDKNYWVEIAGVNYLVKVHNGVESKDLISKVSESASEASVIHLQNAIMKHLSANGIATNAPVKPVQEDPKKALPTEASVHPLPVHDRGHSPCDLVVRLLKWVPGRTMGSLKILPIETLADAGRYLANVHDKLDTLDISKLKAAERYHQWDNKNTRDLRGFVHCIDDPEDKAMVTSVLDAFQSELIDTKDAEQFQQGLIHGDFNDANILVGQDCKVSGVIDFGDSVRSWRILDLSIAMAYMMVSAYGRNQRGISAASACLRGFNSVRPISALEKKHLVLLVASRLACSATLGAYSSKQDPGNEYLLLHAQPAWNALRILWGTDEASRKMNRHLFTAIFEQACSKTELLDGGIVDCSDLIFSDPTVADPLASIRLVHSAPTGDNGSGRPKKQQRTT